MSRATLGIRSSWVGFVAAATTAMASTIAPVAHAQVAHHVPHDGCSAVEVAVVGGTTQANIHDDPHDVYSFGKGTNFAVNMTRRFHNVTAWQLPYYSSAGITASNNDAEQIEFPPYAVSKNRGVDALDAHLSDQAVKCPDTQFVIAGFPKGRTSQVIWLSVFLVARLTLHLLRNAFLAFIFWQTLGARICS